MTSVPFEILGGIFASALFAATLFPAASEAALAAALLEWPSEAVVLVTVAGAGNVLGSVINWLLGRFAAELRHKKWFPVSDAAYERARAIFQKWGYWSLLLAWVPIIGDPLTVIAGALRCKLVAFIILVAIGKVGRYIVVAATTLHWFG